MNNLLNRNFYLIFLLDSMFVVASFYFGFAIRFEFLIPEKELVIMSSILPFVLGIKMIVFVLFRIYRGMWRYTSLFDLINVVKAVTVSSFTVLALVLFVHRFEGYPRSVFIIDYVLSLFFIVGLRVAIRLYYQRAALLSSSSSSSLLGNFSEQSDRKKLLIIGAGDAAEKVIREINDNKALPYRIVGLLDDDSKKIGRYIHGIQILGALVDLKEIITRTEPFEIVIAVPSASREQMARIVKRCQDSGVPFKTLPGMGEIIDDKVSIKAIRDVSYKDLLGRPAVRLDLEKIGDVLQERVVLVTGAGGSIGSELCRQIIRINPKLLVLLDANEENLYSIEMEINHEKDFHNYVTILGKLQDENLLNHVFTTYKPEVVFHAAAYKHVPLIEQNPWEAVFNNIFATQCLIDASICHGIRRFILVSTDKAVRPTNVMGASKRVTEILMQNYCNSLGLRSEDSGLKMEDYKDLGLRSEDLVLSNHELDQGCNSSCTRFMAVRFGNVLGSSGSVIPLFKRQIEKGGPVTVTHPEMTRYFMSIEEAAQLILQAASMEEKGLSEEIGLRTQDSGLGGEKGLKTKDTVQEKSLSPQSSNLSPKYFASGGEIFILEMGTPVKIDQMARDLIRLCGKEPDTEIEIKYTGLRPGEKLYEELITEGEGIVPTGHEKIMVLRPNGKLSDKNNLGTKDDLGDNGNLGTKDDLGDNGNLGIEGFRDLGIKDNSNLGIEGLRDLGKEQILNSGPLALLNRQIEELKVLAKAHDAAGIRAKLKEIVPEYVPEEGVEAVL